METNLEFKNLEEMREKAPFNERPRDILVGGESIFERPKTPAQAEIIKTASQLVADYLKKHNIEQQTRFDEKRICFVQQQDLFIKVGEYQGGDFITMLESAEANLSTIVHELIHAQSSEWRNYNEDDVEETLGKNNKSIKSGFHRHGKTFGTINEGITEKITRDIIRENPCEYIKLKPLFEGRMEQAIAVENSYFNSVILPQKIKERDAQIANIESKIEEQKTQDLKEIAKLDQKIAHAETEEMKQLLIQCRKFYEDKLQNIRAIFEKFFFDGVKFVHEIHDIKIQGIKNDYSFTPESNRPYDFNVEIVDLLVEGIAKHNLKINKELDINNERDKVWEDLQKAYFKGNTFYLRKIDQAFGKGFLRRIDELHQLFITKEEQDNFIEEIKRKVENI